MLKCKQHPTYKGIRAPQVDCLMCSLIFGTKKAGK